MPRWPARKPDPQFPSEWTDREMTGIELLWFMQIIRDMQSPTKMLTPEGWGAVMSLLASRSDGLLTLEDVSKFPVTVIAQQTLRMNDALVRGAECMAVPGVPKIEGGIPDAIRKAFDGDAP